MIHPKEEGATATKKPVLMPRALQSHDQSQRVARHKAQELQLLALPVIAHRVPLAIGQWETAHHVLPVTGRLATDHPVLPVTGRTQIAHHVPLVTGQPATASHLATARIPRALRANDRRSAPIDPTHHALRVNDHHHGLQAIVLLATVRHALREIVRLPEHAQLAIARSETARRALPVTAPSAIAHRVLLVIAHLAVHLAAHRVLDPWVVRVDQAVRAVVDSIVVLSAVESAAQSQEAAAAIRGNVAIAPIARVQCAVLTPLRATARDVAKAAKAANLAQ